LNKPAASRAAKDKRNLAVSLRHLRLTTREIGRSYVSRVESDIVELMDVVDERARRNDMKNADMQEVLRTLDALSIKPKKGRRKDLRRIEKAVAKMLWLASEKK